MIEIFVSQAFLADFLFQFLFLHAVALFSWSTRSLIIATVSVLGLYSVTACLAFALYYCAITQEAL